MKKIYIYGTGPSAEYYYENFNKEAFQTAGFLDSDPAKSGKKFYHLPIYHIDALPDEHYDEIHIASTYLEIVDFLLERGISKQKIVLVNSTLEAKFLMRNTFSGGIQLSDNYVLTSKMAYQKNCEIEKFYYWYDLASENNGDFSYDYCRCKTAQLLAEQIGLNGVEGDIAELGVAQGDFAQLLNRLFSERGFDLFDTFAGFDAEEKAYEIEKGYTEDSFFRLAGDFKDTSVERVMNKMSAPEVCRVHKGRFPETAAGLPERKYAFVSIDCDLYLPIFEGLRYFYPRLSEGGYIMLHDYNHEQFLGVKKAVRECEKLFGRMHKVPLADQGGSLVIAK